jgi:hexosaminidase
MKKAIVVFVPLLSLMAAEVSLLPLPARMQITSGELAGSGPLPIALRGECAQSVRAQAETFASTIRGAISTSASAGGLTLECGRITPIPPALDTDESYSLTVTTAEARLTAPTSTGLLRGMQTFRQLVTLEAGRWAAQAVTIEDKPRFPWRGVSFDPARRFMPVPVVKRTLDAMAAAKFNVFHWHLSDDQGFRVESKRYPLLQHKASDGRFYTQDQVREVVHYAASLGIRVVPEFDVPGHTTAWFAAYPEFASGKGPYSIERYIGIFGAAMDPTKESLYAFLDTLFGEMAGLFPDPYFHIGGDEVNGKEWDANPPIQAFIREKGLKNNEGLQAHFNERLFAILRRHGKSPIGWDEVLHPGIPKDVLIQSWKGPERLATAARAGHRSILSNGFYLDLMYPASQHYVVEPMTGAAAALTGAERALVLGGEACVWTEYIGPENVEFRVWPRAAAVAERLWSPQTVRDVESFYRRMASFEDDLVRVGWQGRERQTAMMRDLAGGRDLQPLRTLAEVVEPVKGYARSSAREYKVTDPLTRLVDAVSPESIRAREFNALAERAATGDEAARAQVRKQLEAWRDNDGRLQPHLAGSPRMKEIAPLSEGLAAVARIGLQAFPEPPANTASLHAALNKAGLVLPRPEDTRFCVQLLTREHQSSAATIKKRCRDLRPAAELLIAIKPGIEALLRGRASR